MEKATDLVEVPDTSKMCKVTCNVNLKDSKEINNTKNALFDRTQ